MFQHTYTCMLLRVGCQLALRISQHLMFFQACLLTEIKIHEGSFPGVFCFRLPTFRFVNVQEPYLITVFKYIVVICLYSWQMCSTTLSFSVLPSKFLRITEIVMSSINLMTSAPASLILSHRGLVHIKNGSREIGDTCEMTESTRLGSKIIPSIIKLVRHLLTKKHTQLIKASRKPIFFIFIKRTFL